MNLRWKKHERETGLRAIGAGPRGSDYWDGSKKYAVVHAHSTRHTGRRGWWFCASVGAERVNACGTEYPDEATAKREAEKWVKAQLAKESP